MFVVAQVAYSLHARCLELLSAGQLDGHPGLSLVHLVAAVPVDMI